MIRKGLVLTLLVAAAVSVAGSALAQAGYYVLDGFGGVHAGGGATPIGAPWPYFGFDIARDIEVFAPGQIYILDGYGGVHAAGGAPVMLPSTPYFGFDIAHDLELVPAGGYVVFEGFGGLHQGGGAFLSMTTPYYGVDVVKDVEIAPIGYYMMNNTGRLVAGSGAPPLPSPFNNQPPSFLTPQLTRDFELVPGGAVVLDGNGNVYGWSSPDRDTLTIPGPGFVPGAAIDLELR